jgi:DNA segregation ATPase FtsK/SpoIIIE-like protein
MNIYRPDYDLHKLLRLPPHCSQEEAKAAVRRALRLTHPDQGGSREIFQIVQWAHGIIENPVYWQLYNRERQAYWRPLLRRALKRPEAPDIWPRGTEPQQEGDCVAAPLPMRIPRAPRAPEGGAGPSSAVPAVADVSPEAKQRVRNMPHGWWHLLKRRLALLLGLAKEAEPEWLARLERWSQEFVRAQEAAARRKVATRAAKRWIKQLTREGTAYMDRSGGQVRKTFTRNTPNGGTAQTTVTIMAGLKWRTQEPQGGVLFETWLVPDTPREDEAQYRGDSHNIHRLWRQLINDAGMLKSLAPPPALPEGMVFELAVNADFLVVRVRDTIPEVAPVVNEEPEAVPYPEPEALRPDGPPLSLLAAPKRGRGRRAEGERLARVLADAIQSFGVEGVRVSVAGVGPTVVRLRLQYPRGVPASRVVSMAGNLMVASGGALTGLRFEQKGLLAEVVRPHREVVALRSLLAALPGVQGDLLIPMGADASGQPTVADLAVAPHLLVAGTTGSGKSVFSGGYIVGLICRYTPRELRMVVVDPKRVDLAPFLAGLPHLAMPPAVEPAAALEAVQKVAREMDRRYTALAAAQNQNIGSYNTSHLGQEWPRIVLHVDELYDLRLSTQQYLGKEALAELDNTLTRIAQLGRAAGIHLVAATQKPTVDAVPTLLRGNLPSRMAFAVGTQAESSVALDEPGAELLAGKGDGLWKPIGAQEPVRVQSGWVTEDEIRAVVQWCIAHDPNPGPIFGIEEPRDPRGAPPDPWGAGRTNNPGAFPDDDWEV